MSTVTSVRVSDACYKHYTHPRNVNKTVSVSDECAGDQPNQSFERRCRSAPFGYQTHCLVCEGELKFDLAEKNPDVAKYQISEVSKIIKKTRKCELHQFLKKVVAERTDPLAVKLAAKLSYASCIHAEEVKYHRDCMQWFLSGVTAIPGPVNYKHIASSKNNGFNNFCDWYESSNHDTTSSFKLFEMQKHIEDNSNEEVYSIRYFSRKLSERYGAEGSKVRLSHRAGLPKIMLLQEEANSIVTDTIVGNWSSSQNFQRVSARWSED